MISVIGDGSLTGGMAYEAMNNASRLKSNFIIVLNDNNMSISENVGGMSNYLGGLRTADGYHEPEDRGDRFPESASRSTERRSSAGFGRQRTASSSCLFRACFLKIWVITYLGPVDGHNIGQVMRAFKEAKRVEGCRARSCLHEEGQTVMLRQSAILSRFHGAEPFDIATGLPKNRAGEGELDRYLFHQSCGKWETGIAKVVAMTAAMPDGHRSETVP